MSIESFLKSKMTARYEIDSISLKLNELFQLYDLNADSDYFRCNYEQYLSKLEEEIEYIINTKDDLRLYDDVFELYGNMKVNDFIIRKGNRFFKRGEISYYYENDCVVLVMKKAV